MNFGKKALILIIIAALAIFGVAIVNYFFENSFYSQIVSSTVYIENGVSGVVTVTDPLLNKTVDINVDYYPLASGSGLIVTNDGYIITAFHVVADPWILESQGKLKKMEDSDIKLYVEKAALTNYISNYNPQLGEELLIDSPRGTRRIFQPEENMDTLTDLFIEMNWLNAKSYKQVIYVKFPASLSINAENSLNARLVDVGDSDTHKDVALLKVESGTKNLPTLNISSQKPMIGENVRIYGYPATGSAMQYKTNQSSVTPSNYIPKLTTGSVMAETPNSWGTFYYETNAPIAEGYSGGPVLNSQNNVIGIVIYELETRRMFGQERGEGYSFFLSSDYIIQLCNKNNVSIKVV